MSKPQSIIAKKAEMVASKFARMHTLSIDDPIVKNLARGLRLAFGNRAWRNKITITKQTGLFDAPMNPPLSMRAELNGVAPENAPVTAEQVPAGQPTNQGVLPAALPSKTGGSDG